MSPNNRVLVTGANGHLGYTLTQLLSERGYHVCAGMRGIHDERKSRHLREFGVELVELDITNQAQIEAAVQGMDGVFHVAAVFKIAGNPAEIIRPTVEGAVNIVRAAHQAGVKKLIYTSSGRTLGNSSPARQPLTENDWNRRGQVPYTLAKIEAEKQVWAYARQHDLDLVSILPLLILGPNIHRLTESTSIIDNMLHNRYPIIPPIFVNIVDVRDVALAHVLAYENPRATGRYIVGNNPIGLSEVFKHVNEIHPIRIPSMRLSTGVFRLYAHLANLMANLRRRTPPITPAQAREMTEGPRYVDVSRTEKELSLRLKSPRESVQDTVQWLLQTSHV